MIFRKTNIEEKLSHLKKETVSEESLIQSVHSLLEQDSKKEEEIAKRIENSKGMVVNRFVFDELETNRIFHIGQIRKICIDYRLRYLDSKYFKGKIPQAAISKIKHLEKQHGIELKGFKIMAPSKLFKLEDKDDPLLFVPIGNDYFYLIHKWGNDLHPLRKALVWPFKNIINLGITVFLLSYLATLMIPNGLFSKSSTSAEFWMLFFFMFKSMVGITIFYGFALGKNFNPAIWNSKYFNS